MRFDCTAEWNIGSSGKSYSYSYKYLLYNTELITNIEAWEEGKLYLGLG